MTDIKNQTTATEFVQALTDSVRDTEHLFGMYSEQAADTILRHYESRSGHIAQTNAPRIPIQGVILQDMQRYHDLISQTLLTLQEVFNAEEIQILLTATNSDVTPWQYGRSLASHVADDLGVDSLDQVPGDTPLKSLLLKLIELDSTQTLALTDFCERFWRNPSGNEDLIEVCESLGLKLADEVALGS